MPQLYCTMRTFVIWDPPRRRASGDAIPLGGLLGMRREVGDVALGIGPDCMSVSLVIVLVKGRINFWHNFSV